MSVANHHGLKFNIRGSRPMMMDASNFCPSPVLVLVMLVLGTPCFSSVCMSVVRKLKRGGRGEERVPSSNCLLTCGRNHRSPGSVPQGVVCYHLPYRTAPSPCHSHSYFHRVFD
ncbi:uncharacterized protein BO72DRAFT_303758 [Aspergillus fijiensis CBS 313.89]|uniref:Uncharacterized protein n=1 Tax=Aspergillus fijiensis CBS 313.89 TaxID=1448319 RepID=A0A8G1S0X3_9EURO|nr:uncharacterized protein BO72DRAFT_303758 [Aspergillus fijiensis CBS 313.89]RAK80391.1 hypothetical protein BO72DRAFT_303758 [Aspergillus fijiensis CBS 313.89]